MKITSLCFVILVLMASSISVPAATKCPPGIHPIVLASYGDIPCANLLGGAVDGKWVQPENLWKRVTAGMQYQLYSPFAKLGVVTGQKAVSTDEDPTTEPPAVKLNNRPKAVLQAKDTVIGICGNWNALPRVPRVQSTQQPTYQQVVRALLDQHGLKTAKVNIVRLWRIDLEGDGKDEVVIEAASPNFTWEPKPGSYSLVLVRKIVNGTVKTIVLDEYYWKKGLSFIDAINRYALDSILDVNGDGVMEIITSWAYYEGNGNCVYTIKNGKAEQVLNAGWGA